MLTVLPAAPALAHGGGGVTDAPNFTSTIAGVTLDENRQPTGPGEAQAVSWRVLANDALLQVTNTSGTELLVSGYRNVFSKAGDAPTGSGRQRLLCRSTSAWC